MTAAITSAENEQEIVNGVAKESSENLICGGDGGCEVF
jgi:hypothetical protein